MVSVQGFRVKLSLKNGNTVTGTVAGVNDKVLELDTVEFADGGKLAHFSAAGSEIKDLKVLDLPKDLKTQKTKKGKSSASNNVVVYSANTPATPGTPGSVASQLPKSAKQKSNNNGNGGKRYQSGYADQELPSWGESNISEIKSAADFDFGGNTARFDKNSALEEFAARDTTDESQRLVGLNKRKTKYEHDENVLSGNRTDGWDSSQELESVISATPSATEMASRKLAAVLQEKLPSASTRRSASIEINRSQIQHMVSRSGEPLPLATPVQLLEVERLTTENFKLTPKILSENCSRGIASLVVKMLGGSSRLAQSNHNLPPLVLLLVGNNRAGARALATGRQLTNHGVRTIAFTLTDHTKRDEFDDLCSAELELYNLAGGKCVSEMKQLTSFLGSIETPVELIVDALQGYDTSIGDLWGQELQKASALISWVNDKSRVDSILSLDIPAGIDAGSGLIATEDGNCLEAKFVVSTGLPLNGLLLAYSNGLVSKGEWTHYLTDIGLPQKLFKKGNLRKFDRSWFNGEFVVPFELADKE